MDKFTAANQKIVLIDEVLASIDEVVALISAFTTDETKQALVQSVIDNIDDIKAVMATSTNIDTIASDLIKGNYLGNRKIDIDLSLNKSTSDATVSYSKATIILTDGTQLSIPFLSGEAVLEFTSHNDIRNYIISHTLWASVQYTECTVEEATSTTNTLIRFRDADGHSSNIERVELAVYSGTALDAKPSYFWANSTSALQTIANRVGDIIALGNDIDKIVELSQNIDELTELQNALASLLDIHTNLTELLKSSTYAQTASTKAGEASASALSASNSAQTASDKATLASQKADIATQKANEIKAITVQATTLTAGSNASASYNTADGKFTFGIPQGAKGDRGEAFKVSAIGLYETRTNYDTQPKDFSFFATDTSKIYFKNSDTSADWSAGVPFGKGDKGDTGETGDGISSVSFISSSLGNTAGLAGATDTYRITMTSGNTYDFIVYNGEEPDVSKSYVDTLINSINDVLSQKASIDAVNNALQALDNEKVDINKVNELIESSKVSSLSGVASYHIYNGQVTLNDSSLNIDAHVPYVSGIDTTGTKVNIAYKNETITLSNSLTQGKNYIASLSDGTYVASPYEPMYLMRDRTKVGENPDYFDLAKQKWFATTGGSELVTNGTFDSATTGWTANSSTLSVSNGSLLVTADASSGDSAYQVISLTVGKKYTVKGNISLGTATGARISVTSTLGSYALPATTSSNTTGSYTFTFTATAPSMYLELLVQGVGTVYFDNISCFEATPNVGAEILSRNYLDCVVYAENGQPTYVEQLPKTQYVCDLNVKNSFDLNQTMKNVTSQRLAGVTHTNTSGKPRFIMVDFIGNAVLTVDGISTGYLAPTGSYGFVSAWIPPNSKYSMSIRTNWFEIE